MFIDSANLGFSNLTNYSVKLFLCLIRTKLLTGVTGSTPKWY